MKSNLLKLLVISLVGFGFVSCGTENIQTSVETSELQAARGGWGCTFDRYESKSRRANCLANAVRGIGKSTADKLIRNNEFRYAPSSWSRFKSYMRTLENRHNLNDLYHNTVERYGSSNKQNLY